jgi:hypothetical protein
LKNEKKKKREPYFLGNWYNLPDKDVEIMNEKLEEIEKLLKYKFGNMKYNKKMKIVWDVRFTAISILFLDYFFLSYPEEFYKDIAKLYKPIKSVQTKVFPDGKTMIKMNFEFRQKEIKENPFKKECLIDDPIELAKIEEEKRKDIERRNNNFLRKLDNLNFSKNDVHKLVDDVFEDEINLMEN